MMPLLAALVLLQADTTGRPCRVAVDSMGHYAELTNRDGTRTLHGGGGVFAHCDGTSTTISADSFAHYSALGRLDLLGNVKIRDTGFALDARLARYHLREERLEAHNQVVAVNRITGSVLRGPNLNYWRAVPGVRDTVEMYATQRPTVEYRDQPRPSADSTAPEPYIIVADRLRLKGDDRVWAGGKVTIDRSDFAARSDSMIMDQTRGFGLLIGGRPSVEGRGRAGTAQAGKKTYTLVGTAIALTLAQRDIRAVKAMGKGEATGTDWVLTADTIDLRIADKQLQQTFAWGDSGGGGGGGGGRPHAISTLYTILSDSLVIDSPGEVLTESRAFGDAFSTAKRDSTTKPSETDWITGDSLTIRFVQEQDSITKATRSRLRELVSRGSARALTHHPPEPGDTVQAGPAINYSRGNRITVAMRRDRVERVEVAGRADGVHLEPRPAPPVVADTVKADTVKATPR
jgi:hypothetical protein